MMQPPVCPSCGALMISGSLGVTSYVAGATWHASRSTWATGGERISGSPLGGMIWMDGYRCAKCKVLLLKY
jgi:hypothetical protein